MANSVAMEEYLQVLTSFQTELKRTKLEENNFLEKIACAIHLCDESLCQLRRLVIDIGFSSIDEEIQFFKGIKPVVYSNLLYYQSVFEIESKRPMTDRHCMEQFLRYELKKVIRYLKENNWMIQYYRCNFDYLDEVFFVRRKTKVPVQLKNSHYLLDDEFFTLHDYTLAKVKAGEMLVDYIQGMLTKLKKNETDEQSSKSDTDLKWTESKVALIELIYALQTSPCINRGTTDIRTLATFFENLFDIELGDYYRTYLEIRIRSNRTKFLDQLRHNFIRRMDDEDAK